VSEMDLNLFKWLGDSLLRFYLILRNKPKIVCDHIHIQPARYTPDSVPESVYYTIDEAERNGIAIECRVSFLLSNEGPVDTSIKAIYIDVKHSQGKHHHLNARLQEQIEIGPRKTWPAEWVEFNGTLWGVDDIPGDIEAELVVEPVAQKPVRRKINLWFA
jgi:hypothetical protein